MTRTILIYRGPVYLVQRVWKIQVAGAIKAKYFQASGAAHTNYAGTLLIH